jgi:hypothetical protein
MRKRKQKNISIPSHAKARIAIQAATPDELTTSEIIEIQAFPLRGLPRECLDDYLLGHCSNILPKRNIHQAPNAPFQRWRNAVRGNWLLAGSRANRACLHGEA